MASFPYYGSKAEMEIILYVLCQLHAEKRPVSTTPSNGGGANGEENGDTTVTGYGENGSDYGNGLKLTPLLVGLAVGVGSYLL